MERNRPERNICAPVTALLLHLPRDRRSRSVISKAPLRVCEPFNPLHLIIISFTRFSPGKYARVGSDALR